MFARTSVPAFRQARVAAIRNARNYTQQPPLPAKTSKGGSNVPLIMGLVGVGGLAAYAYLNRMASKDAKVAVLEETKKAMEPYLNKDKWLPVTVAEVSNYNDNTHIFKLAFEGEGADAKVSGLTTAGLVMFRSGPEGEDLVKDDKGKPVMRPYTPISHVDQQGSIDMMIKEYPTGKLTPFLGKLKKGDRILVKGPYTKFEYQPNTWDKAVFIAGGAGITPAYQLIHHAMQLKDDKTKFTLLFANVSEKDILLRKEWDALAAANPDRLKVVYFLDKAPKGWTGETGYVSKDKVHKHFPRVEGENVRAFVCGPPPQVEAIAGAKDGGKQGELKGVFKELGYTPEQVFKY